VHPQLLLRHGDTPFWRTASMGTVRSEAIPVRSEAIPLLSGSRVP